MTQMMFQHVHLRVRQFLVEPDESGDVPHQDLAAVRTTFGKARMAVVSLSIRMKGGGSEPPLPHTHTLPRAV